MNEPSLSVRMLYIILTETSVTIQLLPTFAIRFCNESKLQGHVVGTIYSVTLLFRWTVKGNVAVSLTVSRFTTFSTRLAYTFSRNRIE